jgi:hypothetical protein
MRLKSDKYTANSSIGKEQKIQRDQYGTFPTWRADHLVLLERYHARLSHT